MSGAGGKIAALAGASTAVAGTSPHALTHVRTLAASRFPVAPSRAPPFDLFRSH